jgi:nucleoside-diphosphate-sugar epimerase
VRILITGGTGMIGMALSKSLLVDGYQGLGIDTQPAGGTPAGRFGCNWVGWAYQPELGEKAGQVDALLNLLDTG